MATNYRLGYDDDRFETRVNRNFHCLICFNVLKDPVMCRRNQHYFCRGCITRQIHTNSRTCPTCADDLTVETLSDVPKIVKDFLDELSIRCHHYDRGCPEFVQLQNLEQHVAECSFKPVVCGNQGCCETFSERDRTYHESEQCEFRPSKCDNCDEISTMMTDVQTEMTEMSTRTANRVTKVANISTKMERMKTEIENMDTKISNLDTNVANVDTKVECLDKKMDIFCTDMVNLRENVEAKFEAVSNEVRGIKTGLCELKYGCDHLKEVIVGKTESKGVASGEREKQHIFVAGGHSRNSVEIFDYRQKLWSLLKPMPEKRWNSSSFVHNNHVTVTGGWCCDVASIGVVNDMIRMKIHPIPDLSINWSDFPAKLPAKMEVHSSVMSKQKAFVTGGYRADRSNYSNCIHKVKLTPPYKVKLVSDMPEPRACHGTVLCEGNILIFGGRKAVGSLGCNNILSSVLSYNIKKKKCRELRPLPYPVSHMATVKWNENAVIIGGADCDGKALNSVIMYDMKTEKSFMLPPMLYERIGCMAVVIQNTIVVLGGADERGFPMKSVEGFSFNNDTWENLPDMKEARWLATAVVI